MSAKQRAMLPVVVAVAAVIAVGGLVFQMRAGVASERGAAMEVKQITVEHVHFGSHKAFDQVTKAFLEQLGHEPGSDKALATGIDPEKIRENIKAAEGSSGLMLFTSYNHGALLQQLAGQNRRAIQYVVGNPLVALEMTQHEIRDSLYAPLRVLVYEDGSGKTCIEYDKPSTLFGQFGNEKATEVARTLDRKLEELVKRSIQ
jgi:uncharacterized protein (DUF302 family)